MNKHKNINKYLVHIIGFICFLSVAAYFIYNYNNKPTIFNSNFNSNSNNQIISSSNNQLIITGDVNHFEGALLANAANETNDFQLAEQLYKTALGKVKSGKKWEVYYNMGCTYIEHKKYEKAISALNEAIKLNPNCDACYERRGLTYKFLKQLNQALQDFNKSISIKPNVYAYYNRSILYEIFFKDMEKAIDDLKMAINLDSKFLESYIKLTTTYLKSYNIKEAKIAINKYYKNINEDHYINYSTYLLLKSYLYFYEDNIDEFLKRIMIVFQRNSEIIQKYHTTLKYNILKPALTHVENYYIDRHEYKNALKVIDYALESAKINNDTEFETLLKKDAESIDAIINESDKNENDKNES